MTPEPSVPRRSGPAGLLDGSTLVGFRRHLRPATVPDEATYLVSRQGVTTLHGLLADVLVPLLDGTRSLTQILHAAAPALTAEEAEGGLRLLSEAGLLRFRNPALAATDTGPAAEAYWDLASLDGARAAADLTCSRLRVLPLAGVDAEPVLAASVESGLSVTDSDSDLTLVLCDDYLSPELERVDAEHRAAGRPWLLTRLCGYEPWIGPFFRPDEGPCWSCLAYRLEQHRRYEGSLQQALGLDRPLVRPIASSLSAGRVMAAQSAVLEAAKWLAGLRYADQDSLRTVDTLNFRTRAHAVSQIPQCPSCGEPGLTSRRVLAPFVPVSRTKAGHNGDHRALSPDHLLKRHARLVSPITGIVPILEPSPGAPDFATTYVSGHNLAMRDRGPAGLRAQSGGKGLTDTEARTSALCEAVERYSGTRHGDEPVAVDTLRALGDQGIHPNACQLYADQRFRDRDRWNRSRLAVPPRARAVRREPAGGARAVRRLQRNAAGGSPEDARSRASWNWSSGMPPQCGGTTARRPRWTWTPSASRTSGGMREVYAGLRREMWALDLTSDFGVPVVGALPGAPQGPAEDIISASAHTWTRPSRCPRAHRDGPAAAGGERDGPRGGHVTYAGADAERKAWWTSATVANQPYLLPDPAAPASGPGRWAQLAGDDLAADLAVAERLVEERGMEMLVMDQTRPDVGLPVAKVVVPGCGTSGPASRPAASTTCRSASAGCRNRRRTSSSTRSRCSYETDRILNWRLPPVAGEKISSVEFDVRVP